MLTMNGKCVSELSLSFADSRVGWKWGGAKDMRRALSKFLEERCGETPRGLGRQIDRSVRSYQRTTKKKGVAGNSAISEKKTPEGAR